MSFRCEYIPRGYIIINRQSAKMLILVEKLNNVAILM